MVTKSYHVPHCQEHAVFVRHVLDHPGRDDQRRSHGSAIGVTPGFYSVELYKYKLLAFYVAKRNDVEFNFLDSAGSWAIIMIDPAVRSRLERRVIPIEQPGAPR